MLRKTRIIYTMAFVHLHLLFELCYLLCSGKAFRDIVYQCETVCTMHRHTHTYTHTHYTYTRQTAESMFNFRRELHSRFIAVYKYEHNFQYLFCLIFKLKWSVLSKESCFEWQNLIKSTARSFDKSGMASISRKFTSVGRRYKFKCCRAIDWVAKATIIHDHCVIHCWTVCDLTKCNECDMQNVTQLHCTFCASKSKQ